MERKNTPGAIETGSPVLVRHVDDLDAAPATGRVDKALIAKIYANMGKRTFECVIKNQITWAQFINWNLLALTTDGKRVVGKR